MIIFIDSNIPMYVIGQDHPNKQTSILLLERFIGEKHRLVTSTEVLQEILHRYKAIDRTAAIQPAFDCLYGIVDEVLPVTEADVLEAKKNVLAYKGLSARDALHVAHVKNHDLSAIMSFDGGFDQVPGVTRIWDLAARF